MRAHVTALNTQLVRNLIEFNSCPSESNFFFLSFLSYSLTFILFQKSHFSKVNEPACWMEMLCIVYCSVRLANTEQSLAVLTIRFRD